MEKTYPITNYITKEQLENMKVGDKLIFTTVNGVKFRISKTNESERCFAWYCLTNKISICSRCKIDYIINAKVV